MLVCGFVFSVCSVVAFVVALVVCSVTLQVQIAGITPTSLIMDSPRDTQPPVLSTYAEGLPSEAKEQYIEKITAIDNADPFVAGRIGEITEEIPPVNTCDLVSYLVLQTSFVTSNQFKARKGLEAYNQFVSGWKDVCTRKVLGKYLVTGRVSTGIVN